MAFKNLVGKAGKAARNPSKVPNFIQNRVIRKPMKNFHLSRIMEQSPQQQDLLADLRSQQNYCLIVLDACRFDMLNDVFNHYFQGEIIRTWTVATNTFEYLQYNWPERYDFPYISAATPVSSEDFNFDGGDRGEGLPQDAEDLYQHYRGYVPRNHFNDLEEVWRDSWDEELRVCPPEPVTERAISRSGSASRMVVHYFQPHAPYIGNEKPFFGKGRSHWEDSDVEIDGDIWEAVKAGEVSDSMLKSYYRSNLERVLGAVSRLIQSTDFDSYVIIGDHGEALGEYGEYAHLTQHPYVNSVPWATIESVKPDAPKMWSIEKPNNERSSSSSTRDRLEDLGYLE